MYDNQSPLLPFFRQYKLSFFSLSAEHQDRSSCENDSHAAQCCSTVCVIVRYACVRRIRSFLIYHICVNSLCICHCHLFGVSHKITVWNCAAVLCDSVCADRNALKLRKSVLVSGCLNAYLSASIGNA